MHDVTEDLLVPDGSLSIREGAITAWPGAWQGANLRSIVIGLGIDIGKPWRKLKKKDRDWLLHTDEQPSVLIKPERDRLDYGYHGTFWSARKHIMHVLADSKSQRCETVLCDSSGAFLAQSATAADSGQPLLAVTFAGCSIAQSMQRRSSKWPCSCAPLRNCPNRAPPQPLPNRERGLRLRPGSVPIWSDASKSSSTSAWDISASGAPRPRFRPARPSAYELHRAALGSLWGRLRAR